MNGKEKLKVVWDWRIITHADVKVEVDHFARDAISNLGFVAIL